jgi:hypothetical protein
MYSKKVRSVFISTLERCAFLFLSSITICKHFALNTTVNTSVHNTPNDEYGLYLKNIGIYRNENVLINSVLPISLLGFFF